VIKVLENLDLQIHRFIVKALHVPTRMEDWVKEHGEIPGKVKTRKGEAAEKAIGDHFRKALEDVNKELVQKI